MVTEVNSKNFESFIKDGVTIVDFFAVWCGPCKMLAPNIETISTLFDGKVKCGKLDIDESLDLAMKYKVEVVPYVVVFKNGQAVDKSIGYVDVETLKTLIEKYI